MPWHIDKENCVRMGTKEDPGKVVKCHESAEDASAHLKALYANADEGEKGGPGVGHYGSLPRPEHETGKGGEGSGWHNPPEGTHTAENAPNFAGGPGADREYGTESDEPPKGSKRCKCTKCGAFVILPKGKQCRDIKCPSCGGGTTQETPREDKPAEGEEGREPKPGREKQATHGCTCPECGKSAQVPQGQKCSEVNCPDCKEAMEQDNEEKAMDAPGPTIHGQGGSMGEVASVMGDENASACKCPHCGEGLPCTAKACPHCKQSIDKVERGEDEKRATKSEGDGQHPASHYLVVEDPEKPTTWHLRVRGVGGKLDHNLMGGAWAALHGGYRGNKYEGPSKEMALAKLKKLYEQEGMDTPGEKSFVSYKSADGSWRWMTLSNWAVVDREAEVVSEQAYRDAIAHAQKSGQWGELDLVHVNGTDVGDCDTLFILKGGHEPAKFGAGGTWYDTAKATRAREAIQADPEHWGVSIKFRFNPQRKAHGVYTGDIQVLKHTILPQEMAASYGTAIAVQGGKSMSKQLDEKDAEALQRLGHTEAEIAELAEKNKALPQEENVVEKEDTTQGATPETLWQRLGKMLGIGAEEVAPVASMPEEARKADEVIGPATAAEPAEKQAEGEPEQTEPTDDAQKVLQVLGETVAKTVGAMVQEELGKRDALIADLQTQIKGLNESVEEKVDQRLRDVPPVVKVAASQVDATAVEEAPKGLTFGQAPEVAQKFASDLVGDIQRVVQEKVAGAPFKV